MNIVSKIVGLIVLLSLVMGVYCAGTNKTYDFQVHLESIATAAETLPLLEDLAAIWTADIVENGLMGAGPGGVYREVIKLNRWPSSGPFRANEGENGARWYPFVKSGIQGGTDEALEFWRPVTSFIDGTNEVIGRLAYTFVWLGEYISGFFKLVFCLSPTSGIVEV